MNPGIKQKWLIALRSGEYKQGKFSLKSVVNGEIRYCCLGVLCDIAVKEGVLNWKPDIATRSVSEDPNHKYYELEDAYVAQLLPPKVKEWAHLESASPVISDPENSIYHDLASANDSLNLSFNEIANEIEKYL